MEARCLEEASDEMDVRQDLKKAGVGGEDGA